MNKNIRHRKECHSHYERNKEYYYERNRNRRIAARKYIAEKKAGPCIDCKNTFLPCQMDFDHRDDDKEFDISKMVSRSSLKRIQEEIDKCDLVCANCHRLRTWKRINSKILR